MSIKSFFLSFFWLLPLLILSSCGHMFYQPDRWKYHSVEEFGKNYEEGFRSMADGTPIHYWLIHHSSESTSRPKGLILFFHGNGMNLTNHLPNLLWVTEQGFDLLLWDYRGYGRSLGESNHENSYRDSLEILSWAVELKKSKKYPRLVAYGQSLGGMILGRAIVDFTQPEQIDYLAIDSSFISYQSLAQDRLSQFWFTWPLSWMSYLLLSDHWAVEKVQHFPNIPVLFIHSEQDNVVPFHFGKQYYDHWQSPTKVWWPISSGQHIETFHGSSEYLREKFLHLIDFPQKMSSSLNSLTPSRLAP